MQRKAQALVVLPWRPEGMSAPHRRWLARSKWREVRGERLAQALSVLGVASSSQGLGALRLWGQTGERPSGWIAAADPVHLEARLDHLSLHPLPGLSASEVGEIFGYLQESLAEGPVEFTSLDDFGYIRGQQPMSTASASPELAQGSSPEAFLPPATEARAHDRLQGEIQMCLHEAGFNRRRAGAGLLPVNGLWLWGGGVARPGGLQSSGSPLPALFADDPLFTGYWLSVSASVSGWAGDLEACLEASPDGFVAVVPGGEEAGIDAHLSILRRMVRRGGLRGATVLFAGGLRADRGRWDALRVWRRGATSIKESGAA
jgi:hypothetical protein